MKAVAKPHWPAIVGALTLLVLVSDYLLGPYIHFPVAFALPVSLAAWHLGRGVAIAIACLLTTSRLALVLYWESPVYPPTVSLVNAAIRLFVFVSLAWMVDRLARQSAELGRRVQTLEGLLPICSFCKQIRHEDGRWEPLDRYVSKRSEARFSHGLCDRCAHERYPDEFPAPAAG